MLKLLLVVAAVGLVPAMAFAKDTTTTLKVSGWHCEGCSAATEQTLKKIDGVKAVKTDIGQGTAQVTYDDAKVSVADLQGAVEKIGYKVVAK